MTRTPEQTLFESYLTPIVRTAYGTAYYLTRDRDEAEDLVQEAAVRAFGAFHSFQRGTNFKAWFLRILTNQFYYWRRRERLRPGMVAWTSELEEAALGQEDAWGADGDAAAAALFRKLDQEQIAAAFATLPEEYRTVCALYFMDEFSYAEIAGMVGCPVGIVRSRLHRGRRCLQRQLRHLAEPVNAGASSAHLARPPRRQARPAAPGELASRPEPPRSPPAGPALRPALQPSPAPGRAQRPVPP
jgi:RNA polymerase sigma-70 factor (ECF subfamily)